MSWIHGIGYRLRELLRPDSADEELTDELRDHLDRESARQSERGAGEDAHRQAVLRAGHADLARENASDDRTGRLLADLARDLQYGVRSIRRAPGFAAAVILSLGLGVGGTTAIFSVVNAVLLRPLPYPRSDETASRPNLVGRLLRRALGGRLRCARPRPPGASPTLERSSIRTAASPWRGRTGLRCFAESSSPAS